MERKLLSAHAREVLRQLESPSSRAEFIAHFCSSRPQLVDKLGELWDQLDAMSYLEPASQTEQPQALAQVFSGWRSQRGMLFDAARVKAFNAAIQSTVRSGDRVIDVGSGSGILSFLAARAGASRVHALEATSIINDARRIAENNGLAGIVNFVAGDAAKFKAAEPVDVVLGEWLGMFVFEEWRHFNAFARVRDANLRPGGAVLPRRVRVFLSPIDDSRLYIERGPGFWERPVWGLDFGLVHKEQLDKTRRIIVQGAKQSLLAQQCLLSVDCATADAKAFYFEHEFEVSLPGRATCHGFLGYFELDLAPGCVLDTSPFSIDTHWHQSYFPMDQFVLDKGDTLWVNVSSTPDPLVETPVLTIGVKVFRKATLVHQQTRCYTLEDTMG